MTSAEIPDWITSTPATPAVHNTPEKQGKLEGLSQNQIETMRKQLLESIISTITQALTGLFLPGPLGAAFDQLKAWADSIGDAVLEGITALFARIEAATGVDLAVLLPIFAPLNFSSPAAFFQSLVDHILAVPAAIGSIISNVLDGILSIPEHLLQLLNKLREFFLGTNSPLNARNIIGLLQSWNLPFLPISSLTNKQPNLFVAPAFTDADSINPIDEMNGWSHDATDGRTNLGCARVDILPGLEQIIQSVPIPVAEDQEVKVEVYLKWAGLAYTGTNPITVDLVRFDDAGFEVGKTTLASLATPATSSGTDWFKIDCPKYTIPDDTTTQIVIQFRARDTTSAGYIKWDDAKIQKVNSNIPQNWILNLVPDLGGIRNWIQDVIDGIISAIRGIPFVGGTIAHIILELTGWHEDTDNTASQAADAYIGLDVTQKIITTASQGQPLPDGVVTNFQDQQVMEALAAQTAIITAQGASITALQTIATGDGNSGISVLEDFEYPAVTDLEDTGFWERFIIDGTDPIASTNGHDATLSTNNGTVIYRFIGEGQHTMTDYQRVTVNIASKLGYPGVGDSRRSHQSVVCRMSDDGTKWVRAYIDNSRRLVVDYRNGGAVSTLYNSGADSVSPPGPGEALRIEPGVGTELRHYRIWRGNAPLRTVIDTSSLTYVGADARGHGMGFRRDAGFGTGAFTQYAASDNAPAPTLGIGFRAFRSSGSGVSLGGSGDRVIPAGTFDTVDRIGAGMTWDSATQTLTVESEGWYLFGFQYSTTDTVNSSNNDVRAGWLYRIDSGTPVKAALFGEHGQTADTFGNGGLIFYCEANSQWKAGVYSSANTSIFGDTAGTRTWFSCALLNKSLA